MASWKFTVLILMTALTWQSYTQETYKSPYRFHELNIYVIPSLHELNWDSPSQLYQGYKKGALAKIFKRESYILGHLFIEFTTPLKPEPVYAGMASLSSREQRELVLRQHIGLGILGAGVQGYLESPEQLTRKLRINTGRETIAAITYRLNETAALRILQFIEEFDRTNDQGHRPARHYGGAFWPLYCHEGAGCSAFGLAMLDLAGLRNEETESWKVDVNIPMKLVGGDINPGNKVTLKDLRSAKNWHNQTGTPNIDYIPFWIYDPTYIYQWIREQLSLSRKQSSPSYVDASAPYLPRLFYDARHIVVDKDKPIFTDREDNNIFIHHFHLRTSLVNQDSLQKYSRPKP